MRLQDLADDLNKSADAARKTAEEKAKQSAARSRAVSYYKEFGNKWFSELVGEIESLSYSFNGTAGEHASLKVNLNRDSGTDSITIDLIAQNADLVCTNAHCSVAQKPDDLKVLVQVIAGSLTSELECDVKIPSFIEFKVQVILKHEKSVIDERATDRYCDINDDHFYPIFKTVKTAEKKEFKTNEFADFVLAYLVEAARDKRRK